MAFNLALIDSPPKLRTASSLASPSAHQNLLALLRSRWAVWNAANFAEATMSIASRRDR